MNEFFISSMIFFGGFSHLSCKYCILIDIEGDVLSGTSSSGVHFYGLLEGWFGDHWWNGRTCILLIVTLGIFSPLARFKRIGNEFPSFDRINI